MHGAGCQRSDLKSGTLSGMTDYVYEPDGYYFQMSPQGDAVRIGNYVRPVRDSCCGEPGFAAYRDGDLNADCYTDLRDFEMLGACWLAACGLPDLVSLAEDWLTCIDPDEPCGCVP